MKSYGVVLVRKMEEKKGERGREKREEKREDQKVCIEFVF